VRCGITRYVAPMNRRILPDVIKSRGNLQINAWIRVPPVYPVESGDILPSDADKTFGIVKSRLSENRIRQ
jgi:hypothetical protein